ncbi:DUF4145 domain-containing protein [Clostridium uliginosum]|uniref:DNA phosphorothioation-dependent restriction protein DptF n=1 Tax=Clostridium uliginosum TaxID=119641 RepID=A0A1I1JSA1_9CLOT|nr:DUF4145 domain-containing protein [Clostridium uliginosum]SFC51386.1 DNA phosphorothioation-dependent restriction protein DptF [Clostridium uliginosum]
MEKDIFDYLDKNYRYLNNYIKQINHSVLTSPHSVIIKGRTFVENLTQEIAKLEGYGLLNKMTQAERLRKFKHDGIFDDDISRTFNTIRILGNKATHASAEGDLEAALNIHKNIYKITCWFVGTYIDCKFEAIPYKSPMSSVNKASDNDSEMTSSLIEKMENLIAKTQENDQRDKEENKSFNMEDISFDEKKKSEDIFEDLMIESIIDNKELDQKCVVQELTRLKESSKGFEKVSLR